MPPYAPNDSSITVEDLESLRTLAGQELLHEVTRLLATSPTLAVNDIARLRKGHSPRIVHAALTMAQLQPRAREKFPDLAPHFIYAIPEALEQATDSAIADHKAKRFDEAGATHILDLCCGIGGDSRALASIAPTTAIDLSPPRLACLRYNLANKPARHAVETKLADVTTFPAAGSWIPAPGFFHIDPARRSHGKRSPLFTDLIPGPDFLRRLINDFPGGAIKLSPAVDFDSLPAGHLELISHNRSVVQAVLWTGKLATLFPPNTRTATMFTNHRLITTYTAPDETAPVDQSCGADTQFEYLFEVDPAFTRARLAGPLARNLHLVPLTDDAGYLAADSMNDHPSLTPFKVLALLPYSEKNVIAGLDKNAAAPGSVEVKTRGKIPGIDTDRLQVLFSRSVPRRQTVLIFRRAKGIYAAIAKRII